jgi:hypothetical protein
MGGFHRQSVRNLNPTHVLSLWGHPSQAQEQEILQTILGRMSAKIDRIDALLVPPGKRETAQLASHVVLVLSTDACRAASALTKVSDIMLGHILGNIT